MLFSTVLRLLGVVETFCTETRASVTGVYLISLFHYRAVI